MKNCRARRAALQRRRQPSVRMSFRTRILVALVLVAGLWLVPSPDPSTGRPHLTHLRVREWLLDTHSPFAVWVHDGRMPALAV